MYSLHKKWSFLLRISSVNCDMWLNQQETADLVTFAEEILNEKLHFFGALVCFGFMLDELRFWRERIGIVNGKNLNKKTTSSVTFWRYLKLIRFFTVVKFSGKAFWRKASSRLSVFVFLPHINIEIRLLMLCIKMNTCNTF